MIQKLLLISPVCKCIALACDIVAYLSHRIFVCAAIRFVGINNRDVCVFVETKELANGFRHCLVTRNCTEKCLVSTKVNVWVSE